MNNNTNEKGLLDMKDLFSKKQYSFIIMLCTWLALLWCATFCRMSSIIDGILPWTIPVLSIFFVLISLICSAIISSLEYRNDLKSGDINGKIIPLYRTSKSNISFYMLLALACVCVLSFIMVKTGHDELLDLHSDSYFYLIYFKFYKYYFYNIVVVCIFPLWVGYLLKEVHKDRFTKVSILSTTTQIIALTLIEFFLFMSFSHLRLVELAIMNCITLFITLFYFTFRKKNKGCVILFGSIYTIFWILLLFTTHEHGDFFQEYLLESLNWSLPYSYVNNINYLHSNATLLGKSNALCQNPYILDFLSSEKNPIMVMLYHGGWISAISVSVIELIFTISSLNVLRQNNNHTTLIDIGAIVAWIFIALKTMSGILWILGITLPPVLPFEQNSDIMIDSLSLGVFIFVWLNAQHSVHFHSFSCFRCKKAVFKVAKNLLSGVLLTTIVGVLWNFSLNYSLSINSTVLQDRATLYSTMDTQNHTVTTKLGMYLVSEYYDNYAIAGPFYYIWGDDLNHFSNGIARYQDSTGNYGYVSREYGVVTDAIYTEASIFDSGRAHIKTKNGDEYDIDNFGRKVNHP